jgi:hypothetical protein
MGCEGNLGFAWKAPEKSEREFTSALPALIPGAFFFVIGGSIVVNLSIVARMNN